MEARKKNQLKTELEYYLHLCWYFCNEMKRLRGEFDHNEVGFRTDKHRDLKYEKFPRYTKWNRSCDFGGTNRFALLYVNGVREEIPILMCYNITFSNIELLESIFSIWTWIGFSDNNFRKISGAQQLLCVLQLLSIVW